MIKMNLKNFFFFFFIFCLVISLTSLSAVEDNNTIEKSMDNQKIDVEKDTQGMTTNKEIKTSSKSIVLNNTNFNDYVTDSRFNENVSDGDTIDIDGKLDSPKFNLTINKAVNIISSKNNSYINLNSSSSPNENSGVFKIISEGAGTNITGLYFYNTHISIENTTNVHVDNITFINQNQSIGFGVGAISVRDGSENISITNSYFKTEFNGGHSNVVFAVAYNCLFENNTIEGYGNNIGNLFYLNTYNVDESITPYHNINITIRNNKIRSINTSKDLGICVGMVIEGYGHIIENNVINRTGTAIMLQYSDSEYNTTTEASDITFINNTVNEGTSSLGFTGILANNSFNAFAGISKAECYNNMFVNVSIDDNIYFHDNTVNYLKIKGDNNSVDNNTFFTDKEYAITIIGENNTLSNNSIGSSNGRGSNAINNSTIYTDVNNDKPAIFIITGENIDTFFNTTYNSRGRLTAILFKDNFIDEDILIFNFTPTVNLINDINNYYDNITLTILNNTLAINLNISNAKLINCYFSRIYQNVELYDSYISSAGNVIKKENSIVKESLDSNQYVLSGNNILNGTDGTFIENITEGSEIIVETTSNLCTINVPVNITSIKFDYYTRPTGVKQFLYFGNDVYFTTGSEGTNITTCFFNTLSSNLPRYVIINTDDISFNNCTFNDSVKVNANNIKFINCTFYKPITINDTTSVSIDNSTFITNDTPILVYDSARLSIENNIINTTANTTIIFDENSDRTNNLVKNNQLITSTYLGNDNIFNTSKVKLENNTPLYATQIEVEYPDTIFKDEIVTMNVSVYNTMNNSLVNSGFIETYIDGIFLTNNTLNNGITSFNLSYPENNKVIPLRIWYYDTENKYEINNKIINLQFTKTDVTIEIDDFDAKLNENTTIIAKFTDERNNPIQEANVTFTVSTLKYTVAVNNGTATITEKVTEEWLDKSTFKITINENDYNKKVEKSFPLTTQKGDVIINNTRVKSDGVNVNFNISIQNTLGENINEGTITIKDSNGNMLYETDLTGNDILINMTPTEDNLISIEYTGEDYYSDNMQTLNISIPPIETKITMDDITGTMYTSTTITAVIVDENDTNMNDGNVIFTDADGNILAQADVTDGIVATTITFNNKLTTTITATYTPNTTTYATSTTTSTLTIEEPVTQLTIEDVTLTAGQTVTLTAKVTDQLQNNITGGKVVFKINGKTIKNETTGKVIYIKVTNGIAQLEYTVPDSYAGKNITIQAVYSGTSKYNSERAEYNTIIEKAVPTLTTQDINTTKESTITLTATITDNNKIINTGKIVFKINGKTLKDANGKVIYAKITNNTVSFEYTLPATYKAKEYTITATLISPDYDKLTDTKTLTVN